MALLVTLPKKVAIHMSSFDILAQVRLESCWSVRDEVPDSRSMFCGVGRVEVRIELLQARRWMRRL